MSRKKRAPKKIPIVDPVYKSTIIPKLINSIMYDGKKTVAEKIIYEAIDKIKTKSKDEPLNVFNEAINNIPSFDYQLIGYRSGKNDSSVILKKGNKEYVVAKGEKLEGTYELIEVTKDEVIFRNKEKLYRIENRVGNNL